MAEVYEVIGFKVDDPMNSEGTLVFQLRDVNKMYPKFYWPAYCWPFYVRNGKIERWIRIGQLPPHMDLTRMVISGSSEKLIRYNLIINGRYSKWLELLPDRKGHKRGFKYHYASDLPSASRIMYVDYDETKSEMLNIFFNSFVGARYPKLDFQLSVEWFIHNGRVYGAKELTDIRHADILIGYTQRNNFLISVPATAFRNKAYNDI